MHIHIAACCLSRRRYLVYHGVVESGGQGKEADNLFNLCAGMQQFGTANPACRLFKVGGSEHFQ